MEPPRSWGPAQAAAWLRGLEAAVQGYPFEAWGLSGPELLGLEPGLLEALGVRPVGHQELLLEAVEQLRSLDTGLASTSLRTLTERLQELAQGIQGLVQRGLWAADDPQPPSLTLLARAIELLGAAKELFSWLNRYLFSTLNDFSASQDIILLCAQLAETLQADLPAAQRSSGILQICQHIEGICESIVGCSPPALLDRSAVLQSVGLALLPGPQGSPPASPETPTLPLGPQGSPPASPSTPALPLGPQGSPPASPSTPMLPLGPQGSPPASPSTPTLPLGLWHSPPASPDTPTLPPGQWSSPPGSPETPTPPCDVLGSPQALLTARLGFEITSTSSCLHFVSATSPGALAAHGGLVLPGDEIVQVNEQVVVGWTPVSLARKLLEKGNRVTLVLKKIPLDLPSSPPSPRQQPPGAFLDAADSPGTRSGESPGSPVSLSSSIAADLDSGAESVPDPVTDEEQEEAEREPRLPGAAVEERPGPAGQGAAQELWDSGAPLDTPGAPEPPGTELSPRAAGGAEPGPEQGSPSTARRPKGVATRLSRRRVSCRDLGRADCDGWLLRKKEHVGFMAQKWKRCWVVLKGHTLYWYNHPNDERAAGLINVATYNLESTREQKKKYVFQLCHQTYKPFVFAAETLADLSMWVSHLVTAKTKHTLAQQAVPDKEEDCYSETEAEDPDDEAPRHGSDPVSGPGDTLGSQGQSSLCHLLPSLPQARKRLQNSQEKAQLSPGSSPQGSPRPCSPLDPGGEDLASLARCLRQGGLSLTGQRRALTQEQCRKSFLRRNRNPHINERVHAVRALQSTLKAKLAELQALEQLLGEAALTSDTFRRWKEEHQELYQELREGWAGQRGQGGAGEQHREAAEP